MKQVIEPPVFAEPWQARAFALAVSLSEHGLFDWNEWTAALGREIPEHDEYWVAWVAALERILQAHGLEPGT